MGVTRLRCRQPIYSWWNRKPAMDDCLVRKPGITMDAKRGPCRINGIAYTGSATLSAIHSYKLD